VQPVFAADVATDLAPLAGSTKCPSCILSHAVKAFVNSEVYQSLLFCGGAAAGAAVAVELGVAATGDGAGLP
jgi:hypothetical protein